MEIHKKKIFLKKKKEKKMVLLQFGRWGLARATTM
jgi:hypothetical protein